MINEKRSIAVAESVVDGMQFWKMSMPKARRKIVLTIRKNYISAKSIFTGFFGAIRESCSTDYVDDVTMVVSKILITADKGVLSNAVTNISDYGFRLAAHDIGNGKCKIVMTPDEITSEYLTDCYLNGVHNVNHSSMLEKMKLKYRHIQ